MEDIYKNEESKENLGENRNETPISQEKDIQKSFQDSEKESVADEPIQWPTFGIQEDSKQEELNNSEHPVENSHNNEESEATTHSNDVIKEHHHEPIQEIHSDTQNHSEESNLHSGQDAEIYAETEQSSFGLEKEIENTWSSDAVSEAYPITNVKDKIEDVNNSNKLSNSEILPIENEITSNEEVVIIDPVSNSLPPVINIDEMPEIASMDKESLVKEIKEAFHYVESKEYTARVRAAHQQFFEIINGEKEEKRKEFLSIEGNDPKAFEYNDPLIKEFNEAYKDFKAKKGKFIEEMNKQRELNLVLKNEILIELRKLLESAETKESFDEFKKLQSSWKFIGPVTQEENESLNKNYQALMSNFYDRQSIYSEMKKMDMKRNLDIKEKLVEKLIKTLELEELKDIARNQSAILEEYRNTGNVPKENYDDLTLRYRAAITALNDKKEKLSEGMQLKRQQNYEAKKEIVAQIQKVADFKSDKSQEWFEKNKVIVEWIEKWKVIGGVPMELKEGLQNDLNEAIKLFNNNRNIFYKEKKKLISEVVARKEELIAKAEELLQSEDMNHARNSIIELQKKWKEAGNITGKASDELWNKFRSKCDEFFNKLDSSRAGQKQAENQNLEDKYKLVEKAKSLLENEAMDDVNQVLGDLRREFEAIGYVPFKEKDKVRKDFYDALNKVNTKFRGLSKENEISSFKTMVEGWNGAGGNDKDRVSQERFRLGKEIKKIENEISTLENNMEFFKNSKMADSMKQNLDVQISRLKEKMSEMQSKLKVIRNVETNKPA